MAKSKSSTDNPKVKLFNTKKYGKGVFAIAPIRKGEVIAVFDGKIYEDDFESWTEDLYNHTIQIAKATWQDSKGLARYINHSCEPNCGIKKLTKVVAMRSIAQGEEITWDYEMTEKNLYWKMRCRCGHFSCRKIIGNYANMPKSVRKKYAGYISDWLLPAKKYLRQRLKK